MKQKITLFFLSLIFCTSLITGQTMINNFETTGEDGLTNNGGGISTAVVANPDVTGANTTANCLKIGRNGTQWWIFTGIDVNDLAISDTDTKFLSVMVYGPTTDLGVRFDSTADDNNGTNGGIIRPDVLHTGEAGWQQIIFPIVDSQTSTNFTKTTLFKLVFHPDIAGTPVPGGQMLNDADTFLYIDEIQILDSKPLSTKNFKLEESISLYPNPAESSFRLDINDDISVANISVYNVLGKKIKNVTKMKDNEYDISNLSTGLYMVKIIDNKGAVATKKLYKK
jgi:hypothetical protein